MSIRRIGVLLRKEVSQGPRNYIFVFAVVGPLIISFVISLIFGSLLSEKPRLGFFDEGSSEFVALTQQLPSLTTNAFKSAAALRDAVERGAVDIGIVLPKDFDSVVEKGTPAEITTFVWGESLAKNRIILGVTVANVVRQLSGQRLPIDIETVTLGDQTIVSWTERLLPFVVLMTLFLGGMFFTATTIIDDKTKRTMVAVIVTPTTPADVMVAKGLLGFLISMLMGVIILAINRAFGARPGLLLGLLALGTVMACELGVICGIFIKDFSTLFAIWKTGGILLFGPAFVYMFPAIPQWIGKIFPTYYVLQPIIEISIHSGVWADIAAHVYILVAIDIAIGVAALLTVRRLHRHI